MKILFIGSRRSDYVQDILFSGLVKLLGIHNVIELNWNPKYHLPVKKYPKNLGYVRGSLPASLIRSRKNYNLVLVASCKPDCIERYLTIARDIPSSVQVVFADGGDREEIGGDLARMGREELYQLALQIRPFNIIFKREYLKNRDYEKHVFPLPIGMNFDCIPTLPLKKKYQVSFWAVEGHPIRTKVLNLLQDQFDCAANGTTLNQEFKKYARKGAFYLQELAACKVVLSFRGGGWDTMRYWEVPAVGGFMISQPLDILIPNDFRHEKELVHCREDLSDLLELCRYYLQHEEKRKKIAAAAKSHALQHHSDTARARYLLSNC